MNHVADNPKFSKVFYTQKGVSLNKEDYLVNCSERYYREVCSRYC